MHGDLEGHRLLLKFWVPPKVTDFLSSQGGLGRLGRGVETMKCMYFMQLTTSTDFITISVRFFQQGNFNNSINSNPFSDL